MSIAVQDVAPRVVASSRGLQGRLPRRLATGLAWSCALGLLTVWLALALASDRWWAATLLLYAPRWIWAGPPLLVALLVGVSRPRLLWLPLVSFLFAVGPIMGFCFPWRTLLPSAAEGPSLRIITCNCGTRGLDIDGLAALIRETQADVVLLQECHSRTAIALAPPGWTVDNAWGLCIVSRYPFRQVDILRRPGISGWFDMCAHYRLATPDGPVELFNLHLATPRGAIETALSRSRKTPEQVELSSAIRGYESRVVSQFVSADRDSAIVAGDFNLPSESAIFQRYWSSFQDAFAVAGLGWGNTRFTRWHGVRIDHVLAGGNWRVEQAWVGPDVGSDHRPLVAELRLRKQSSPRE